MDRARQRFFWRMVADVKAFFAQCQGASVSPEDVNPFDKAEKLGEGSRVKVKPSKVNIDGTVER